MKPSSYLVLLAAVAFLAASISAIEEGKPLALVWAYFSLWWANLGFSLLD